MQMHAICVQDYCGSYVDRGHRLEENDTYLKLRLPFAAVTQWPLLFAATDR